MKSQTTTKTAALTVLFCLLFSCFPLIVNAESPWLPNYNKRTLFYWQSNAAGQDSFTVHNQTGFNSASNFYIFNETKQNFEDLRITLADGTTELSLWNQTTIKQVSVKVWCNFPSANASYYLYWNNLAAVNAFNMSAVFTAVISNTILALPLNEGTGTAANDYSGNGNNGVITGASWVAGRYGSGLSFNGLSDLITVAHSASLDASFANFSLSFWIDPTLAANKIFMRKVAQFEIDTSIAQSGVYGSFVSSSTSYASRCTDPAVIVNSWQHVAVVVQSGAAPIIYVNGSAATSYAYNAVVPGSIDSGANALTLGNGGSSYYQGVADDFCIFDGLLSASDVSALYNGFGDPTVETGKIYVKTNYLANSGINLFGNVETASLDLLVEDAIGLAVIFGVVAIAFAIVFAAKRK